MQDIVLASEQDVKALVSSISKPRLTKYLQAERGDERRALSLYHWNSQLAQALYLPLQSWEIILRNRLSAFFIFKYGEAKWPYHAQALRNFNRNDRRRLDQTIERLRRGLGISHPTTDQIVAALSAGFWVSQFGRDYAAQYGWKNNLRFRIFTNDGEMGRELANLMCNELLDLRNRVAHHEPIFHLPLDRMRRNLERLIAGMCGPSAAFLSSACSFSEVWKNKPGLTALAGERQ